MLILTAMSCSKSGNLQDGENITTFTPVMVTSPATGTLADTVSLNAVSAFLLKTQIKASINGYLREVYVKPGENVKRNQALFKIISKEASSIGNTIGKIDTSLHFNGLTIIRSPGNGYITQVFYQTGNYVQEGEPLATISDINSMVFLLNLPYELSPYLSNNKHVTLYLPDGEMIRGTISVSLPFVDQVSQTQNYIINMDKHRPVPENLIAKVSFIRQVKNHAVSLPKPAILTDEQQTGYWIMKMTDSTTAVKIPIEKGIETSDRVEIISPVLRPEDKILVTGNYGLPDTAKVIVEYTDR